MAQDEHFYLQATCSFHDVLFCFDVISQFLVICCGCTPVRVTLMNIKFGNLCKLTNEVNRLSQCRYFTEYV